MVLARDAESHGFMRLLRELRRFFRNLWWLLFSRKTTWTWEDGEAKQETHRESWSTAWALIRPMLITFGPYYKWINGRGKLDCGCCRNPLTRRIVLFTYGCKDNHGGFRR